MYPFDSISLKPASFTFRQSEPHEPRSNSLPFAGLVASQFDGQDFARRSTVASHSPDPGIRRYPITRGIPRSMIRYVPGAYRYC